MGVHLYTICSSRDNDETKEPDRTHPLASTGLINKNDELLQKARSSVSGSADGSSVGEVWFGLV